MPQLNIHPVLTAFIEYYAIKMKAASMNGICTHLEIQATLEDFSGFVYSKEKICGEDLKMDRMNTDALFAVTGVDVADRWGKTFEQEWSCFVIAHCLRPTTLPPIVTNL